MLQLDTGTFGALAQLGERLICIQEVSGSIPLGSTKPLANERSIQVSGSSIRDVCNREGKTDPACIAARLEFIRVW